MRGLILLVTQFGYAKFKLRPFRVTPFIAQTYTSVKTCQFSNPFFDGSISPFSIIRPVSIRIFRVQKKAPIAVLRFWRSFFPEPPLRAPFGESLAPWYFDKFFLTRSLYAKIDEKCVIKSTCLEAIKYN